MTIFVKISGQTFCLAGMTLHVIDTLLTGCPQRVEKASVWTITPDKIVDSLCLDLFLTNSWHNQWNVDPLTSLPKSSNQPTHSEKEVADWDTAFSLTLPFDQPFVFWGRRVRSCGVASSIVVEQLRLSKFGWFSILLWELSFSFL